jgi:pyruvate dehydrogenase E2 component (dihydrolipoamide acetyltransferase)
LAVEVVMPAMEMDQDSARVVRWLKDEGESVRQGEPLLEIETDKVTVEIEAPGSGTLTGVTAAEGDDVPVGTTIALIIAGAERGTPAETPLPPSPPAAPAGRVLASPKARRLAAEAGIDLSDLSRTVNGPIRAGDVAPVTSATDTAAAGYRTIPLEGVRKRAAERLLASYQQAPHISLRRAVDATKLLESLDMLKASGQKATLLAGIARVTAASLVRHPRLNGHFADDALRVFDSVALGIAVALDDGLIVPVVRDAQAKDIPAIAAEVEVLSAKARAGGLEPSDVRGGTFTISNLGMFAVDDFTPILNPPEVAILAVGAVRRLPAEVAGESRIRPIMNLTLVVDHRAIDGAVAAAYLTELVMCLESGAEPAESTP